MRQAAERPESFPIRERDLRRVNLQRFPYHFLFRIIGISCGFWLSATTGDVPPLASGDSDVVQLNRIPRYVIARHDPLTSFRSPLFVNSSRTDLAETQILMNYGRTFLPELLRLLIAERRVPRPRNN
jgi:hypothetical protein